MGKVKAKQETIIQAAKDTLGHILNPLTLPDWLSELKDKGGFHRDPTKVFEHAWNLIISESED